MDVRLSVVSHDNEAEEATIQISDGEISVIAYCHPFDFSLVSSEIVLDALFVKNILQVNQFCLPKKTKEGYYSRSN